MEKLHWILYALLSSTLYHGDARPTQQPSLQLRNFHRPETSTVMSRPDGTPIKRRDSAAEFLGITTDSKAPRQHHNHVLSESKNSAQIVERLHSVPITEAPPSMQMDKLNSQSPQWSATKRERWLQVQPSSFPHFFSSPNPYAISNPTPFAYPSPSPNPSRSAYQPFPFPNPSRSAYPSTVSYPSPSFAPGVLENYRVSLSPLPHQNNLSPLHLQPSSPSPNWIPEEMQTATAVTGDNRGDGSKDLMAKLWTFVTVPPTPVNHGDFTTKTYLMMFDEHGTMHMNFSAGVVYWDNKLNNNYK